MTKRDTVTFRFVTRFIQKQRHRWSEGLSEYFDRQLQPQRHQLQPQQRQQQW